MTPCRCGCPQLAGPGPACANCGHVIDGGSTDPLTVWLSKAQDRRMTGGPSPTRSGQMVVRLWGSACGGRLLGEGYGASVEEAAAAALNNAMARLAS